MAGVDTAATLQLQPLPSVDVPAEMPDDFFGHVHKLIPQPQAVEAPADAPTQAPLQLPQAASFFSQYAQLLCQQAGADPTAPPLDQNQVLDQSLMYLTMFAAQLPIPLSDGALDPSTRRANCITQAMAARSTRVFNEKLKTVMNGVELSQKTPGPAEPLEKLLTLEASCCVMGNRIILNKPQVTAIVRAAWGIEFNAPKYNGPAVHHVLPPLKPGGPPVMPRAEAWCGDTMVACADRVLVSFGNRFFHTEGLLIPQRLKGGFRAIEVWKGGDAVVLRFRDTVPKRKAEEEPTQQPELPHKRAQQGPKAAPAQQ